MAVKKILASKNGLGQFILLKEVMFFESYKHGIRVHCIRGTFDCNGSVSRLEASLNGEFCRISRSFLVSVDHMKMISSREVVLNDEGGTRLPIGRKYAENVRTTLENSKTIIMLG